MCYSVRVFREYQLLRNLLLDAYKAPSSSVSQVKSIKILQEYCFVHQSHNMRLIAIYISSIRGTSNI